MVRIDKGAIEEFITTIPEINPSVPVDELWREYYIWANDFLEAAVRKDPEYVPPEIDKERWCDAWNEILAFKAKVWDKFKKRPSKSSIVGSRFDNGVLLDILGQSLAIYDGLRVSGYEYSGGTGVAISCAGSIRDTLAQIRENLLYEQGSGRG